MQTIECRRCNCDIVTVDKIGFSGIYVYTLYCTVLSTYPHSHEVFWEVNDVMCDECGQEQSVAYSVSTYDYLEM